MPSVKIEKTKAEVLKETKNLHDSLKDYEQKSKEKLQQAVKLLAEKKAYVKNTVNVQINFHFSLKYQAPYGVFVSWYDHGLQERIFLVPYKNTVAALSFLEFEKDHNIVESYSCRKNLVSSLPAYRQSLASTKDWVSSILQMLSGAQALNLPEDIDLSTVKSAADLYPWIVSSDSFFQVL